MKDKCIFASGKSKTEIVEKPEELDFEELSMQPFVNEEQWGPISASVSDAYIEALTDGACYGALGPHYEVLTVFIERGDDLARLHMASLAGSLRGAHRAGCFFLWPTLFQDGTAGQMGMAAAAPILGAMRGLEAAGVPTRFPHPSQLYALLPSKEWTPQQQGESGADSP